MAITCFYFLHRCKNFLDICIISVYKKKKDKKSKYSIGGIVLFIIITLYLLTFIILRLGGMMPDL